MHGHGMDPNRTEIAIRFVMKEFQVETINRRSLPVIIIILQIVFSSNVIHVTE